MTKENCATILKILTDKKYVWFTHRCNRSIQIAMIVLSKLGRENVLYQEEGGWLTYDKYIVQAQLNPITLVTDDGLIYEKDLNTHDQHSALILNSLAGYIALHNMDSIANACATNDIILINDVSGSIGLAQAKIGDVIVGSFGNAKPVNVGSGGFIATNDEEIFELIKEIEPVEVDIQFTVLEKKLRELDTRRKYLQKHAQQIKTDLKDMDIVHPDHNGLNVVIRFDNDMKKQKIIDYCKEHEYEYTQCPREIRILDDAISIEVKRLE